MEQQHVVILMMHQIDVYPIIIVLEEEYVNNVIHHVTHAQAQIKTNVYCVID